MKFCITFLFYVFLLDNATVGHNWADVFLQQTFRPLQKVKKKKWISLFIVNSDQMYSYAFGQSKHKLPGWLVIFFFVHVILVETCCS